MRILLFVFAILAAPASAQVVVKTGEHGAFTRLVLQFNGKPNVAFGRTETGYELAITEGNPAYDLTRVFQLIGRQRLKSIWADPRSGNLILGIGCACHAVMEAAANGLIVIDIHDGAAQPASVFETTLAGSALPPLGTIQTLRPRARPLERTESTYQWMKMERSLPLSTREGSAESPLISSLQLQDLRQRLAKSIDAASATGIVELRPPEHGPSDPKNLEADGQLNLHIGPVPALSDEGQPCRPEEHVGVPQWHTEGSPAEALAKSRNAILGEFDLVDQSALLAAVRTHLYFGFGAEARNLIESFGLSSDSTDILVAISQILDGHPVDENPFADKTSCKGQVALWALAALPGDASALNVDANSVVQAFMALPVHLQTSLASDLSAKLIAANKLESADLIASTLSRAMTPAKDSAALVATEISLAKHDLDGAQHHIDSVTAHTDLKKLILKAETAFQKKQSIGVDFLTELEALYFVEARGPDGPALTRALAVTRALEGEFEAALSLADLDSETARDVWGLLAEKGGDGLLLTMASQTNPSDRLAVTSADRALIFDRLLSLGLPTLAEDWVDPAAASNEMQARLALSQRDGRRALDILVGVESPSLSDLRAEALAALNKHEDLALLLAAMGQDEEAMRVKRWTGEWNEVALQGEDPWSRLAQSATRGVPRSEGPSLAQSKDAAEGTAADIEDIASLLQQTTLN